MKNWIDGAQRTRAVRNNRKRKDERVVASHHLLVVDGDAYGAIVVYLVGWEESEDLFDGMPLR